jgi:hypothetical protein
MMTDRKNVERRMPDRRRFFAPSYNGQERRTASRRDYQDRRSADFWRFSWLRMTVSGQLAG